MQARDREVYWRRMVTGHSSSGMSIGAYCRRAGVSEASFFLWRKRLGLPKSGQIQPSVASSRPVNLVPVRVLPPAVPTGHPISVELPNGIWLRVPDVSTAVEAALLLGRGAGS